jgi:hypothetical protein
MIPNERGEGQFQQVSRARRSVTNAKSLVVGEVSGFQGRDDSAGKGAEAMMISSIVRSTGLRKFVDVRCRSGGTQQ